MTHIKRPDNDILKNTNRQPIDNELRPSVIKDYIGQEKVKERILMCSESAKNQAKVLDHVLFTGAPGLGKTTLAHIIANVMGANIITITATTITRINDLARILIKLKEGDVLFIDEIHRLRKVIAEGIYMAMEDFRIDFFMDKETLDKVDQFNEGVYIKTSNKTGGIVNLPMNKFTLIGATTRQGILPKPLLDRFGIKESLDFYSPDELSMIVKKSAKTLGFVISDMGAVEIGKRARGTPRIANRLLKRVIDYAVVNSEDTINSLIVEMALDLFEIDDIGLDKDDRKLLRVLTEIFQSKPVGIGTLCGAMNEEKETVEDIIEPYLIQAGLIEKTSRGRIATQKAVNHMRYDNIDKETV